MANTAPYFENLDGNDADGVASYTLGAAAVLLDTDASVFDAELGSVWTGASLMVQRHHDVNLDDTFGLQFSKSSAIDLDAGTGELLYDFGSGLATFAQLTIGTGTLQVDFTGAEAYDCLVDEVLRAITFATNDAAAAGSTVAIGYVLEDMPGQTGTLAGYGDFEVAVYKSGSVLDLSAAGGLTFDFDGDPGTAKEYAASAAVSLGDFPGTEDLRVSNQNYPFGSGPGFLSGTISGLSGFNQAMIDTVVGTGENDHFYVSGSRAYNLAGGYGADTFNVDESTAGVKIDGGGDLVTESTFQPFDDAVVIFGNSRIEVDLAATDVDGYATLTRTLSNNSTVVDLVKDIEIVRATTGNDVIKGGDDFNAFGGFEGDDTLEGRGGNDWLQGWIGFDTIDGGKGYDTASFAGSYADGEDLGVKIDLGAKDVDGKVIATITRKSSVETDTLVSVESVEGTSGDDEIIGDAGDNILAGFDGKNVIDAGDGNDLVYLIEKDTASTEIRLGKGDDFVVDQYTYGTTNVDTLILVGTRADYDVWDVSAENGTSGLVLIQEQYYSYAGEFLGIKGRAGTSAADEGTDIVNGVEKFLFLGADGKRGTADDEEHTAATLLGAGNKAPAGADGKVVTGEDTPYALNGADFGFADEDASDTLAAVRIDATVGAGTLKLDGATIADGTIVSISDIDAGKLIFVSAANAFGDGYSSFKFSVQDSRGAFDVAPNTFKFDILPENDAPVAVDDSHRSVDTYESVLIDVLANDSDADNDALSIVAGSVSASSGTAVIEDGKIRFTAGGAAGAALISYQATDGKATSNVGHVTLVMVPINDDPPEVVTPIGDQTSPEDATWTFAVPTGTFRDQDGEPLTLSATLADGGELPGWLDFSPATGTFTGTPPLNFDGELILKVTATDPTNLSVSSTFTLDILLENDVPVAVDDSHRSVDTYESVLIDVLANDSDADNDALSIVAGSVSASSGTAVIEDGKIRFTAGGAAGAALISYQATDGKATSNDGHVMLVVVPIENAPIANPDANQALAIVESGVNNFANQVTIGDSVLDNDNDPDPGDSLRVAGVTAGAVGGPVSGAVNGAVLGTYGVLRMGADGTWTYILDNTDKDTQALKLGDTVDEVFTYTVTDTTGRTASSTLTVKVRGDDDAPLVSLIPLQTGDEDEPLPIDVLAHASDPEGGQLTLTGSPTASHGSVVISGGQLLYTPAPGYNGPDTIIFTVQDETGLSITRTVPVSVVPVNDAPVTTALFAKGAEDTLIPLTLTASDPDSGDRIETFRIDDKPDHGSLYLDAAMKQEMSAGVDYATGKDGKLAVYFQPADNYAGPAFFMFRAGDGELLSDPSKMTITVAPVNDAPRAADKQSFPALEDAPYKGKLSAIDPDGDTLKFALHQKGTGAIIAKNGKVALASDGSFTYTPNANFFGQDTFTYTVSDPSGARITRTAVVDVASVNDAPTFSLRAPIIGLNEDTAGIQRYNVASSFKAGPANESGQLMVLSVVGNSNENLFQGTPFITQAGQLSFILLPNASGSSTVTIRLEDNGGEDNGGVYYTERDILINVRNVNDAPQGMVEISDTTPIERDVLNALALIADLDGIPGPLTYQWQIQSGTSWVDIAGANASTLTVEEGFAHKALRVQVSYVDGGGVLERVTSAATSPVQRYGIAGTPANNLMLGGEGDDVFLGSQGADTMRGFGGIDTVSYLDSLRVPRFDITLWPTTGVNVSLESLGLQGGVGIGGHADLDAYTGIENVIGSPHDDNITGNDDPNRLEGRDGRDRLRGQLGEDTLIGGDGDDHLEGGDHDDLLYGDGGNDVLIGGWFADTLYGGAGNDHLYAEHDIPPPIPFPAYQNWLYGGDGNDRLFGGGAHDTLHGDAGADRIDGGAGNDTIEGGDDNDVLIGGLGRDFISGGRGNDTIWGAAEGIAGLPEIAVVGDNQLYGGEGNDTIYGNGGRDLVVGGAGYDRLTGGLFDDVFKLNDGDIVPGTSPGDLILDFSSIEGDRIDLSGIDANVLAAGDQSFVLQTSLGVAQTTPGSAFVGGGQFAPILNVTTDAQFVYLNTDFDAQWEMVLEVRPGVPIPRLGAGSFEL